MPDEILENIYNPNRKLLAASVGELQDDLVLPAGLIMYIGHRKEIWKLTFRALALRRSESRNYGLCGLYTGRS